MKKVLLIASFLLLLIIGFLVWLTSSEAGLHWASQRISPYIPGQLTIGRTEGSFLGPASFNDIEYRHEDMIIKADEIKLEWLPKTLLAKKLEISQLNILNLEIELTNPGTIETTQKPNLPPAPVEINLPLELALNNAQIDGLTLKQNDQVTAINRLRLEAKIIQNTISIESLDLVADDFAVGLSGEILPAEYFQHKLKLNWQFNLPSLIESKGSGQLSGNIRNTSLSGSLEAVMAETGPIEASFDLQRLYDETIIINRLNIQLTGNTELDTQGRWLPAANGGDADLILNWKNLHWPLQGVAEYNSAVGSGSIKGNINQYFVDLNFEGPKPEQLKSSWSVKAEGNLEAVKLALLEIKTLDGKVKTSGDISWKNGLSWQARSTASNLNPAGLLPEWPGKIDATLISSGNLEKGILSANANISELVGELRGYPVSLKSSLKWRDNSLDISQLVFSSGNSKINAKGHLGEKLNLTWQLSAENLAELYPQSSGSLMAEGKLSGERSAPIIAGKFSGRKLSLQDYKINEVNGSVSADLLTFEQVDASLTANGLMYQGEYIESIDLSADNREIKATLTSEIADVKIGLKGEFATDSWQGKIDAVDIITRDFSDWHLAAPARLDINPTQFVTDTVCLENKVNGEVCASTKQLDGDWHMKLKLSELPQSLFKPWLADRLTMEGRLNAQADLEFNQQQQILGKANIQLSNGLVGLPLDSNANGEPGRLAYEHANVEIHFEQNGTNATTEIKLNDSDYISAWLKLPEANLLMLDIQRQAMQAKLELNLQNLKPVEAILPEVSELEGSLLANLSINGTLGQPEISGKAQLRDATFLLPRINQRFDELNINTETNGLQKLNFDLSTRYSNGVIKAQGDTILNPEAGWPSVVNIQAEQLMLANLLQPWMPQNLILDGVLDTKAQLQFKWPDQLTGEVNIRLPQGTVSHPLLEPESDRWAYQGGSADIILDKTGIRLNSTLSADDNGFLNADVSLPGAKLLSLDIKNQPLQANARVDVNDISFIEALVPEVSKISGKMIMDISANGSLAEPGVSGKTEIRNANFRLPRIGLNIEQVNFDGNTKGFEQFNFDLRAKSGEGFLTIKGNTNLNNAEGWPSEINISGENFEVSRIPEANVLVSPDINIKIKKRNIDISGAVHIPYAKIQPKDVSTATRVSEDTVIIGGEQPPVEKWLIDTKLRLTLGERINFFGFGFEGQLGGSLLLEDKPGQLTRATGEVTIINGRYRAYGQRLDVEKGRLVYTGGTITNPGLDIQAIRKTDNVTAGLKVKGTANQPVLELFSIPAMGQTDAFSYLLLGRPIENASGEEGAAMAKAAMALSLAGGDRLARTIGDRFGLDEMRLESSDSGDQASLVVGRYLSPKLYVSYGVGFIEAINTLSLRYKISDKWQLKAESGEAQGADLIYTIER